MQLRNLSNELEAESEKLTGCIHCGLCLQACPTYLQLGNENDSPRGRLLLMRSVAEGRLELQDPKFESHIDLCLGCRACETACPAGVSYGHLLEATRASLVTAGVSKPDTLPKRLLGRALRKSFPFPSRIARLMRLNRWLRDSGFLDFSLWFGPARAIMRRLSPQFEFAIGLLLSTRPVFAAARKSKESVSIAVEDLPVPDRREVTVFTGCVMEGLFKHTNDATTRVLAANGCLITQAPKQICCGALHAHSGELALAKQMARKNIEAFERSDSQIIINSAGCGAMLKEYGELLHDDPGYAERAKAFSARVKDVSEYLNSLGVRKGAAIERSVTYDAPCHLYHAQRITSAPQDVLRNAVPDLDLRPLDGFQDCCGGAGIYNLSEPEMSDRILTAKMDKVRATGAELLVTANPGCHMQLGAGCRGKNVNCEVVHVVDILDESYRRAGYYNEQE